MMELLSTYQVLARLKSAFFIAQSNLDLQLYEFACLRIHLSGLQVSCYRYLNQIKVNFTIVQVKIFNH